MASQEDDNKLESKSNVNKDQERNFINVYKKFEYILKNKLEPFAKKIESLIEIWKSLGQCNQQNSDIGYIIQIMDWAKLHTLNIVLTGKWKMFKAEFEAKLLDEVEKTQNELMKISDVFSKKFQKLADVIKNPWDDPVLANLLHDNNATIGQKEIEFFCVETAYLVSVRLKKLCESQCEDLALNLVTAFMNCYNLSKTQNFSLNATKTHILFCFDIHVALLYRYSRKSDIVELFKKLTLEEGLHLIRRFAKKRVKISKVWRNYPEITFLASQVFVTAAVTKPIEESGEVLKELLDTWINFSVEHTMVDKVEVSVRRIIQAATAAQHIYICCDIIHDKFGMKLRTFTMELYIRALTTDMNNLESQKSENDTEKVDETTKRLARGFYSLADILKDNIQVSRECALTAFSLEPTLERLRKIEDLARQSGFNVLDTGQIWECKLHPPVTPSDELCWICNTCGKWMCKPNLDLRLTTNFALHEALNFETLGISPQLCDDLAVVLNGPRYHLLSWLLRWEDLHRLCEMYLNDMERTKNLVTELKFVDIDYSMFATVKREPVDEMAGIEKGYESYLYADEKLVNLIENCNPEPPEIPQPKSDPNTLKTLRMFRHNIKRNKPQTSQSVFESNNITNTHNWFAEQNYENAINMSQPIYSHNGTSHHMPGRSVSDVFFNHLNNSNSSISDEAVDFSSSSKQSREALDFRTSLNKRKPSDNVEKNMFDNYQNSSGENFLHNMITYEFARINSEMKRSKPEFMPDSHLQPTKPSPTRENNKTLTLLKNKLLQDKIPPARKKVVQQFISPTERFRRKCLKEMGIQWDNIDYGTTSSSSTSSLMTYPTSSQSTTDLTVNRNIPSVSRSTSTVTSQSTTDLAINRSISSVMRNSTPSQSTTDLTMNKNTLTVMRNSAPSQSMSQIRSDKLLPPNSRLSKLELLSSNFLTYDKHPSHNKNSLRTDAPIHNITKDFKCKEDETIAPSKGFPSFDKIPPPPTQTPQGFQSNTSQRAITQSNIKAAALLSTLPKNTTVKSIPKNDNTFLTDPSKLSMLRRPANQDVIKVVPEKKLKIADDETTCTKNGIPPSLDRELSKNKIIKALLSKNDNDKTEVSVQNENSSKNANCCLPTNNNSDDAVNKKTNVINCKTPVVQTTQTNSNSANNNNVKSVPIVKIPCCKLLAQNKDSIGKADKEKQEINQSKSSLLKTLSEQHIPMIVEKCDKKGDIKEAVVKIEQCKNLLESNRRVKEETSTDIVDEESTAVDKKISEKCTVADAASAKSSEKSRSTAETGDKSKIVSSTCQNRKNEVVHSDKKLEVKEPKSAEQKKPKSNKNKELKIILHRLSDEVIKSFIPTFSDPTQNCYCNNTKKRPIGRPRKLLCCRYRLAAMAASSNRVFERIDYDKYSLRTLRNNDRFKKFSSNDPRRDSDIQKKTASNKKINNKHKKILDDSDKMKKPKKDFSDKDKKKGDIDKRANDMNPRVVLERLPLDSNYVRSVLSNVPGLNDYEMIRPSNVNHIVNVVQISGGRSTSNVPVQNTQTSTQITPHIQRIGQPRSDKPEHNSNIDNATTTTTTASTSTVKSTSSQPSTLINILSQQIIRPGQSNCVRNRSSPLINILSQQIIRPATTPVNKTTANSTQSESQPNNNEQKQFQGNATYFQNKNKKSGNPQRIDREMQQLCLQRKQAALERELRLQKSLSEECEDLGVDEPSTSDLFPEADILFDANHSPSFDQSSQDLVKRPPQEMKEENKSAITLFSDDDNSSSLRTDFLFESVEYQPTAAELEYDQNQQLTNGQSSASNESGSSCEDHTLLQNCASMSDVTLNSPVSPDPYHENTPPSLHKYKYKYSNRRKGERHKQTSETWTVEVSSSEDTTGSTELGKSSSHSPESCTNKHSHSVSCDEELSDGSYKVVRVNISKSDMLKDEESCEELHCDDDLDCSPSGRGARRSVKKMCSCCNGSQDGGASRKRPSSSPHTPAPHKKAFLNKKR